ncbi:MAG TPA: FmdB family transcriptional regulator [Opitutaceae bacterium]|nr:FmdB family transcriptional regulator [Opitutaceae bacterium]
MPIYEFYSPDNNRIYQFYARTLAQGGIVPKCPDNPAYRMRKMLSAFAVTGSGRAAEAEAGPGGAQEPGNDARMEAAMGQMEREFSGLDENDPRAMGRMMRRMADLTGEPIGGEMEEVVRKLEEGADPDSLEEQLGGEADGEPGPAPGPQAAERRRPRSRRAPPVRDPRLYDYP